MISVRTRILLFFSLFAAASFLAVLMSGRSTRIIGAAADNVVSLHLPMVHALGEMEISLRRQDITLYRFLSTGDKFWLDETEKERVEYAKWTMEAQSIATEEIELDKLASVDELYVQYDNHMRQILLTYRTNPKRAFTMVEASEQYLNKIQMQLDQLKGIRQGMTIVKQQEIRNTLDRHRRLGYYFLASIIIFFLALAFYLWRYLVMPLTYIVNGIRNFTRGKTDIQIPPMGKDELGELQEAFNEMSREIDIERKRLRSESQSDPLTGLFNMRYFRLQLAEEFSRSQRYGRPLTLLMIDVDNFKIYNDRNGHPAGDIVLKEVSRIFIRNVRGTDIVARYGGEEFVVLLPETQVDAGANVAEKIRRAVEEHYFPFARNQGNEKLTVSIGISSYPDVHVTSDQDLVEAADKALYNAKKGGRNAVQIYSSNPSAPAVAPSALSRLGSILKK